MTNVIHTTPYLETSRHFPQDPEQLRTVQTKSYNEIASAVNSRVIGIFELMSSVTGEKWFANSTENPQTKRQTQRIVYQFTGSSFNHGLTNVTAYTRIYGTFTDGTFWYPLPYVDPTPANQIGVKVSATQVVITAGGTAPTVTSGFVILEYLQQ